MKTLLLFFLLFGAMQAQEYAVIGSKRTPELSPAQIKAVFLKKLTHYQGLHLVPINLPASSELRKKFEKELLHMNFIRLKSYWSKQHYLGNRPPLSLKSQESALLFVAKVQGAITYVNIENITKDVKILYRWRDE